MPKLSKIERGSRPKPSGVVMSSGYKPTRPQGLGNSNAIKTTDEVYRNLPKGFINEIPFVDESVNGQELDAYGNVKEY